MRLVIFLLMAALIVISAEAPVTHAPSDASKLATLTNQERADAGVPKLEYSGALEDVAQEQALRMAKDGTIYHNDSLRDDVPPGWCWIGENVGMASSIEVMHEAFMDSPSHRENVLDKVYNKFGVGVYSDGDTLYASVVFGCYAEPKPPAQKAKPKPMPSQKKEICAA